MRTKFWILIIIGVVVLSLIVGGIVGRDLFPKKDTPVYTRERASFILKEVRLFAWSNLEDVCYSKFKDYANDFQAPYKICFVSRSGSGFTDSLNKFNVACNCYGTNYHLRK